MRRLHLKIEKFLPVYLYSWFIGKLACCKITWFKNLIIIIFYYRYKIDLNEAERKNLYDYNSFYDFFTRKLQINSRQIIEDDSTLISPVDGEITAFGNFKDSILLQAKNISYDINKLLAFDPLVENFKQGQYVTIYLSPADYHRVHMPTSAKLISKIYIPGKLISVRPSKQKRIKDLYVKNERVITFWQSKQYFMAIILVGTVIVSAIELTFDNQRSFLPIRKLEKTVYDKKNIFLKKGAEIGFFGLGSTVIAIWSEINFSWDDILKLGVKVKFGQKIASLICS